MYTNLKDQLKNQVDLKEYISKFIDISGEKGVCPFHGDSDPSFSLKDDKFWKCFGCGRNGDIYTFIMLYHKVSFADSIKMLAEYLNIDLEEYQDNSLYLEAMFDLQEQFKNKFYLSEYYLKSRKIDLDVAKLFNLGYVSGLKLYNSYKEIYKEIGLIDDRDRSIYEDSITFPYFRNGKVIGFTFKPLKVIKQKYVNINNNVNFKKSEEFFGFEVASKYIEEDSHAIIVEGYFDVLRMHQTGHWQTVAQCGSSLSENQVNKLKRIATSASLMMDGDYAGVNSTVKGFQILEKNGISTLIIILPDNEDPDSWLIEDKEVLNSTFLQYCLVKQVKLDLILETLGAIQDLNRLDTMLLTIYQEFKNIPRELIRSRIGKESNYSKNSRFLNLNSSELVKGWVFEEINDIPREILSKVDFQNFNRLRKIKEEYGYLEIDKMDSELISYLSPSKLTREQMLKIILVIDKEMKLNVQR